MSSVRSFYFTVVSGDTQNNAYLKSLCSCQYTRTANFNRNHYNLAEKILVICSCKKHVTELMDPFNSCCFNFNASCFSSSAINLIDFVPGKKVASEEDLPSTTSYKPSSHPQEWQAVKDLVSITTNKQNKKK